MLRRYIVLLLILVTYFAYSQESVVVSEAQKNVLVDFVALNAGGEEIDALSRDFSGLFNLSLSTEERARLNKPYTLDHWKVVYSNSAEYPETLRKGLIKPVEVIRGEYAGQTVLGLRAFFPNYNYDMIVEIQPPFIPYNPNNIELYDGYGTLQNVGKLYQVFLTVYGLNQDEHVFVLTEDNDGTEYEFSFGPLNFIGWRELIWTNPRYILNEEGTITLPLYPQKTATLVLKAIKIVHSSYHENEDFITYIKDIKVTSDKVVTEIEEEIEHEEVWEIIRESNFEKKTARLKEQDLELYFNFLDERKRFDYVAETAGTNGN